MLSSQDEHSWHLCRISDTRVFGLNEQVSVSQHCSWRYTNSTFFGCLPYRTYFRSWTNPKWHADPLLIFF